MLLLFHVARVDTEHNTEWKVQTDTLKELIRLTLPTSRPRARRNRARATMHVLYIFCTKITVALDVAKERAASQAPLFMREKAQRGVDKTH